MKRAARVRTRLAVGLPAGALITSGSTSPPPGDDVEPAAERGRFHIGSASLQAASDTGATRKSLDAIQILWNKDVPAVPMGASAVLTMWQKNVHGVVHGAGQTVRFEPARVQR